MDGKTAELKDIIRVEGIVSKGYGMLPYFVMQSSFLSVNAKCIYAYFCSYTGGGENRLFPGIGKIMSDLQMSKNRYYEAYRELQTYGLLSVEQKKNNQHFDHNEYTLLSKPFCVMAYQEKYREDPMGTRINAEGILAWGYGNIPKAVMLDDRLDAKEKSLYAYFCSLAGFRFSIQPDRDRTIKELGISHNTYNKYMFKLQELNYITVTRTRAENGRGFGSNIIFLNVRPDEEKATLNSSRGEIIFTASVENTDISSGDLTSTDSASEFSSSSVQPNFEETKNKETKTEDFGENSCNSVQPNFKEAKNKEPKSVEAKNEETNNIVYNSLSISAPAREAVSDQKNGCVSAPSIIDPLKVKEACLPEIPSLAEVRDFIDTAGYAGCIDYQEFFNYYQELDWCDGNGKPVLSWRAKIRSWASHQVKVPEKKKKTESSSRKKNDFKNFEERSTDYDKLIESYENSRIQS